MKPTIKQQYECLRAAVNDYVFAVKSRRAVCNSSTPAVKKINGVKGQTTVQVAELVTIVRTATALNKHVVLEVGGDSLRIQLVDAYPLLPFEFDVNTPPLKRGA